MIAMIAIIGWIPFVAPLMPLVFVELASGPVRQVLLLIVFGPLFSCMGLSLVWRGYPGRLATDLD